MAASSDSPTVPNSNGVNTVVATYRFEQSQHIIVQWHPAITNPAITKTPL